MDIFSHATELTDDLAASVAALEVHCAEVFARPQLDAEQLRQAIRATWPRIIADAKNGDVSPHVEYVAALYERLAAEMGIKEPGIFADRKDISWLQYYTEGCGDEARCEDAWVVGELYWGGYVKYLQFTLGWLLMNAIRIQQNLPAITPTPESTDRFTDDLRGAGPNVFDAESLRGLFYEYDEEVAG